MTILLIMYTLIAGLVHWALCWHQDFYDIKPENRVGNFGLIKGAVLWPVYLIPAIAIAYNHIFGGRK